MKAPTEHELAREGRRILRQLLGGARLTRTGDGRSALVSRGGRVSKGRLDAAVVEAMRARGWLEAKDASGATLAISDAGKGWYLRAQAGGEDAFAAQHRIVSQRMLPGEDGRERAVKVNMAESPLTWMLHRGLIEPVQCEAGERLRRDYTLAQMSPRLGVDFSAPCVAGRRALKDAPLSDTVLAAKQRFGQAMRAAGPELSDVLFDVCCALSGLEDCEHARGWPRASAKVVLKIALDRLARHYGLACAPLHARMRGWSAS